MSRYFREFSKELIGDSVFSNVRRVMLPDGTRITARFAGAIHQVTIDVRRVKPLLVYLKNLFVIRPASATDKFGWLDQNKDNPDPYTPITTRNDDLAQSLLYKDEIKPEVQEKREFTYKCSGEWHWFGDNGETVSVKTTPDELDLLLDATLHTVSGEDPYTPEDRHELFLSSYLRGAYTYRGADFYGQGTDMDAYEMYTDTFFLNGKEKSVNVGRVLAAATSKVEVEVENGPPIKAKALHVVEILQSTFDTQIEVTSSANIICSINDKIVGTYQYIPPAVSFTTTMTVVPGEYVDETLSVQPYLCNPIHITRKGDTIIVPFHMYKYPVTYINGADVFHVSLEANGFTEIKIHYEGESADELAPIFTSTDYVYLAHVGQTQSNWVTSLSEDPFITTMPVQNNVNLRVMTMDMLGRMVAYWSRPDGVNFDPSWYYFNKEAEDPAEHAWVRFYDSPLDHNDARAAIELVQVLMNDNILIDSEISYPGDVSEKRTFRIHIFDENLNLVTRRNLAEKTVSNSSSWNLDLGMRPGSTAVRNGDYVLLGLDVVFTYNDWETSRYFTHEHVPINLIYQFSTDTWTDLRAEGKALAHYPGDDQFRIFPVGVVPGLTPAT